jgi:hypothetical protein
MGMEMFVDRVGLVGALCLYRMIPVIQCADVELATAVSSLINSISLQEEAEFNRALDEIEECSMKIGPSQVVFLDREFYVHTVAILCGYIGHTSVADRARLIRTVAADFWSSVDGLLDRGGGVAGLEVDDTLEGIEMRWLDRDWDAFQAPSGLLLLYDARIHSISGTFGIRRRIAAHAAHAGGWFQ